MKTINIITAVIITLKKFDNDVFSIYNITKSIREDIDNVEYELSDLGDKVLHDDVKDAFLELLFNVFENDYETRDSTKGYREFRKIQPTQQFPTPIVPNSTIANIVKSSIIPLDVQKKLCDYVSNNSPVSMKKIQSRLKGHPYTCKDIMELLDSLGIIDSNTKSNPPSKVMTI